MTGKWADRGGRGVPRRRARRAESGLTLIEMLVTIAVMTAGVVGVAGGLAATELSARISQSQAQLEVAMRVVSDFVRSDQLPYAPCAQPATYQSPVNQRVPAGFQATVNQVWVSTTRNGVALSATCTGGGADVGVQEISLTVSSTARSLTRYVWKEQPSGTCVASDFLVAAPASATAGTSFSSITLTAYDTCGNVLTDYSGSELISWSGALTSPGGTLPSYPTSSVVFSNGVSTTALSATLYDAATNALTASDTVTGLSGSTSVSVGPGAPAKFTVAAPASATAGTSFSGISLTATDAYGNPAAYSGSHTITWSGALTSPGGTSPTYPTSAVSFSGGVSTTALSATLYDAAINSLTASDTVKLIGGSTSITVSPGAASKFAVSAPASATAGTSFSSITLTADDAYGNLVTTYTGAHSITWSGAPSSPCGTAPSYPASSVAFTAGVSTTSLTATLYAAGSESITASASSPSVTGSATITVRAGPVAGLIFTSASPALACASPVGPSNSYTVTGLGSGGSLTAYVSFADAYGNPAVYSATSSSSVSLRVTSGSGTVSPSTLTIPAGATTSSASFKLTLAKGNGSTTVSATFGGYTAMVTGSK